jgi:hypothetical protein
MGCLLPIYCYEDFAEEKSSHRKSSSENKQVKRILLTVPKSVLRQFRKQALEAFPVETCAFLIGTERQTRARRYVEVKELWVPDDVRKFCTSDYVLFQPAWFVAAEEHAKEAGLEVVAFCHTHPYRYEEIAGWGRKPDCSDSENDLDYFDHWDGPNGIFTITETKTGRKRMRYRFWGPRAPVEMV